MATIWLPASKKELAERLARRDTDAGGKAVFPTYMHLMVFAAMVGHYYGRTSELEPKDRGAEIYDEVFERSRLDGLAFLLALHERNEVEILREKNDLDCWRILESYACAGLEVIEHWLLESPADRDGVDTILSRLKQIASESTRLSTEPLTPNIDFS